MSPKAASRPAKVVPEAAWLPARLASDLALARELASKLDAEKGIASNSLLASASPPAAAAVEGNAAAADGEAAAAAKEDGEGESLEEQVPHAIVCRAPAHVCCSKSCVRLQMRKQAVTRTAATPWTDTKSHDLRCSHVFCCVPTLDAVAFTTFI